ncbi:MAG: glycoside hydrolase family 99-like domain-containing protein [Sphingomonadaceae bacterium]
MPKLKKLRGELVPSPFSRLFVSRDVAKRRSAVRSADAARDRKDWPRAVTGYAEAIALLPARWDLWVQYGHALKEHQQLNEAVDAYREAIARAPGEADPHLHLGHLYKRLGRYDEAIATFESLLAINPESDVAAVIAHIRAEAERKSQAPKERLSLSNPINGAPVTILPSTFEQRMFVPATPVGVVANVANDEQWEILLAHLSAVEWDHDLLILGSFELDLRYIPDRTRTVSLVGTADPQGSARSFGILVRSAILEKFDSVCWISPSEGTTPLQDGIGEGFFADKHYGIAAESFVPLTDILTQGLSRFLQILLPRVGRKMSAADTPVPRGPLIWLRPFLLRHIAAANVDPNQLTVEGAAGAGAGCNGRDAVLALLGSFAREAAMKVRSFTQDEYRTSHQVSITRTGPLTVKTIAFYLPQFHPIPENDQWWGKGFTEWSNVTRGRPLFRHHHQPRTPADLGFYDLRLPETQRAQADLAKAYDLHGFCYYYYWFDERKLLNRPIEQMLASGEPDLPFCVCWANENWSRNWDGQNRHVLLQQHYTMESNLAFIREIIPMMKDRRYIRHYGKPVLIVYRISIIPDWIETAALWREECRRAGIGEIHLCAVRFGLERLEGQPFEHGLDAYVLFPPHETERQDIRSGVADLNRQFGGEILSYDSVVDGDLHRFSEGYPWPVHRGAMLAWDNTARRQTAARIFHGATPARFRAWLSGIIEQETRFNEGDESLLFINAWNEWAEGAVLEPDQRWGRSWLEALKSGTSQGAIGSGSKTSLTSNAARAPAPTNVHSLLKRCGSPFEGQGQKLRHPKYLAGGKPHETGWPSILLCAHISGHHLFGGERSFLDVLAALETMPMNVVVTLPSGNNTAYVEEVRSRCEGLYIFPYPQWMDAREPQQWLVLTFADIIVRHGITLVHANTIVLLEPLIAARLLGRTTLVHARELISLDEPLLKRMALPAPEIIRQIFERSDAVIGNSQATCQMFARQDSTFLVPNAVDLDTFDMPNDIGDLIRFGIISSNTPKKGIIDFLQVARLCQDRVPNAQFIIVGPDNDETARWRREAELGHLPNVIFAGYRDSPAKAVAELNVLLNLSSFAESFGRTVAEALAARRPVIAYEWGALPELIDHRSTGILIPYRDVDAVAEAVAELAGDPDAVRAMGDKGRAAMAERFSQANLRARLAAAYQAVLKRPMSLDMTDLTPDGPDTPPDRATIIIPVYNAADELRNCLASVLRHTDLTRDRLIVIDDCSTDERVTDILATLGDTPGVIVLKNDANIGYTHTINRGIVEAGDDDIILLNSDTVVTPKWLEGLRATAYASSKVGTVTAMSDNAGAFSFPRMGEANHKPAELNHDAYGLLVVQATGGCSPVEVPTGSGFCLYIRRALIAEIGIFDDEAFPRGYGEENDFCMRAVREGWRNLVSPWSFVFHVRNASFGAEKETLVKAGVDTVIRRYPDYAERVKAAFESPDMAALRAAAAHALTRNLS